MKFEPGDLVMLRPETSVFYAVEASSNVGIVVTSAVLMYVHCSPDGEQKKFWAYDIIVDGRTYKNVPEEVLKGLNEEDETNIE